MKYKRRATFIKDGERRSMGHRLHSTLLVDENSKPIVFNNGFYSVPKGDDYKIELPYIYADVFEKPSGIPKCIPIRDLKQKALNEL